VNSAQYDRCLALLRYVKQGDFVEARDFNVPEECLFVIRAWIVEIVKKYNVDPSILESYDSCLARLVKVAVGDIIEPEHHNAIVDCLHTLRDILSKLETQCKLLGYDEGFQAGVAYCLDKLVPLKAELVFAADIVEDVGVSVELPAELVSVADVVEDVSVTSSIAVDTRLVSDVSIEEQVGVSASVEIQQQQE